MVSQHISVLVGNQLEIGWIFRPGICIITKYISWKNTNHYNSLKQVKMWKNTKLRLGASFQPTISGHAFTLDPGVGESFPWTVNRAVVVPRGVHPSEPYDVTAHSMSVPRPDKVFYSDHCYFHLSLGSLPYWKVGRWVCPTGNFEICSACSRIPKSEERRGFTFMADWKYVGLYF